MVLKDYYSILNGKLLPRFRVAAKIPAGMDTAGAEVMDLDSLLKHHNVLAKPFYEKSNPDIPAYFPRNEISLLELKLAIARRLLGNCTICENRCGVNRIEDERGKCRVGAKSYYASEFLHFGEESELVPSHTIFFTGCTFVCIYCQNWDIAHGIMAGQDLGVPADSKLVDIVIKRQNQARNLNLVGGNPDQHLPTILRLLVDLAERDYTRPIVWNSNLYLTEHALDLLTGIADVHLADFKYGTNECGRELSNIDNYWDIITRNLLKVYPVSEIMIRHLVLPGHVDCCTSKIVGWVAENIPNSRFNLMFQYHPDYRAGENETINRYLTQEEREKAMSMAIMAGLV